jgi:hypothetical protein
MVIVIVAASASRHPAGAILHDGKLSRTLPDARAKKSLLVC